MHQNSYVMKLGDFGVASEDENVINYTEGYFPDLEKFSI